ncbi:MAG: diacylglycerol kinase family protein, partial [Chloroflexota bacterium]
VNPVAHNVPSRKRLDEANAWLQEQGWSVVWRETAGSDDAQRFAAEAAEQHVDLVIGCGGDGTVNGIANGLVGSESTMGTIPAGMSNIWAREIGLDKRPLEAVQKMVLGDRRLIDTGRAGRRHFVLFIGYGIDAAVIQAVPSSAKDRLGAASYLIPAARQALSWKPKPIAVRVDGVERMMDVLMAVVGNTRLYAGITKITPIAIADDGQLDACIYCGRGKRDIVFHAMRTLLQLHRKSPKVLYRHARRVEFDWDEPLPAQVDGEALLDCPREVVVVPQSLWVATPSALPSSMFSRPSFAQAAELSLTQPRRG